MKLHTNEDKTIQEYIDDTLKNPETMSLELLQQWAKLYALACVEVNGQLTIDIKGFSYKGKEYGDFQLTCKRV